MAISYREFIRDWCKRENHRLNMLISTNDGNIIGDLIYEGAPERILKAIADARQNDNFEIMYEGIHSYGRKRRDFTFTPPDGECGAAQDSITEDFMRENGIVFYLRYELHDPSEESVRIIDLR